MSKVIEDGLVHFRAKLNLHLKIVNDCYAEIARLEALQRGSNPTTGAVDLANESCPHGYKSRNGCPVCGACVNPPSSFHPDNPWAGVVLFLSGHHQRADSISWRRRLFSDNLPADAPAKAQHRYYVLS